MCLSTMYVGQFVTNMAERRLQKWYQDVPMYVVCGCMSQCTEVIMTNDAASG